MWSLATSLSYFYMVAAWGGYAFIINLIPIFVLARIVVVEFTVNLYISYSCFYIIGSLLAMQVPFVWFAVVFSSEHLASHVVFVFVQVYALSEWIKDKAGEARFKYLVKVLVIGGAFCGAVYMVVFARSGWSGRSMSLLDPTYAKKFVPIIASVSEHQPTTWASFFFDLHFLTVFAPVGLYFCLIEHTPGKFFIAAYGVLSVYFACVMVRLLLVLAPAVCMLSAIGLSETLHRFTRHIRYFRDWYAYTNSKASEKKPKPEYGYPLELAIIVIVAIGAMIVFYVNHSVWTAAEAYSSPTVIMASRGQNGERRIIDDYREAYYWLRMNTAQEARIASWWDYGYQITGFSNRTVMVDNNTWNNTHIATVGMIFSSDEETAAKSLRELGANYVLVIFGGLSYYSGDDINKFLWMVRISAGVFPQIKEENYLNRGQYRIDKDATETMKNCLMYRLCYYRFGEIQGYGKPPGFDVVRNVEIGEKNIKLKHFREVYTSEHWIVRIYEVLPENTREPIKPKSVYSKNPKDMLENELTRPKVAHL
jgi:dolichyl-diphosphooligosaccharide---protein glycosyltransferase